MSAAGLAHEALSRLRAPAGGAFLFGFGAIVALARSELALGRQERVDILLAPVRAASQRMGWHEADASASLVVGLGQSARGERDEARASLTHALVVAREHGLPGVEWEACAALGRRAESAAIVDRLARGVADGRLAAQLVRIAQS
jgi:hypothetical protein